MNNPTFSQIANHVRNSVMPTDLKNNLLLLFFRMKPNEQNAILNCLGKSPDTLPLFAELLTELEQGKVSLNDTDEVEKLLKKYLEKIPTCA
jgi:hypothetical protein